MTTPNFKHAIIDLDIPVFKAAAIGQKTMYNLFDSSGTFIERFESAKDVKNYITDAEEFMGEDVAGWYKEPDIIYKDVEDCYKALDFMIETYLKEVNVTTGMFSIGGGGNFRDNIATVREYKGNRQSEKPKYFYDVRDYAIRKYNPKITNGIESDDQISLWLYEDYLKGYRTKNKLLCERVMIDLEKDCRVTPGWHYKPDVDEEPVWISTLEANRWLFTQTIAGDTADNYIGCPRWGVKKAGDLLADCKTTKDIYQKSLEVYQKVFDEEHKYVSWVGEDVVRSPEEMMHENLRLAFMLREGDIENDWKVFLK